MTEDILERAKEYREAMRDNPDMPFAWEIIDGLIAEVERLRSLNESLMENGNDLRTRCQKAETRIKELEADRIEARAQYLLFMNDNPGCIAWNFDELDETEQDALREQARYMLELEEPWAYIQLREAREQIKRLEAAFLESEACAHACMGESMPVDEEDWQAAREALERIKAETGSGDHVAGANKLILTAEQREEEGKRDA